MVITAVVTREQADMIAATCRASGLTHGDLIVAGALATPAPAPYVRGGKCPHVALHVDDDGRVTCVYCKEYVQL